MEETSICLNVQLTEFVNNQKMKEIKIPDVIIIIKHISYETNITTSLNNYYLEVLYYNIFSLYLSGKTIGLLWDNTENDTYYPFIIADIINKIKINPNINKLLKDFLYLFPIVKSNFYDNIKYKINNIYPILINSEDFEVYTGEINIKGNLLKLDDITKNSLIAIYYIIQLGVKHIIIHNKNNDNYTKKETKYIKDLFNGINSPYNGLINRLHNHPNYINWKKVNLSTINEKVLIEIELYRFFGNNAYCKLEKGVDIWSNNKDI